jgi:hypothetical protein
MANLTLYGATRGIVHGILIDRLITPENQDLESSSAVGWAMGGSIAEGVGGYLWARGANLSSGSSTAIGDLGDFGLLNGLGLSSLGDYLDEEHRHTGSAIMLAGSALGLAGGSALAAHRSYTYGDAVVMRDGILLGVFAAEMVTRWFDPSHDKTYISAAMAGSAVGLVAGDRLVRNTDFTSGQSVVITLGMIAGGLFGLGAAYVTRPEDNGMLEITTSMVGAGIGFAATYHSLGAQARHAAVQQSSWRMEFSPAALAVSLAPTAMRRGALRAAPPSLPLIRAEYRF